MDFFRSAPPTDTLRIETQPPGADARTSQGQTCRTPCELTVQATELTVTLALNGYETQTIPVAPDPEAGAKLSPNPLIAELQMLPPPATTKKKPRGRSKKKVNTAATQPPAPTPAAAAAPPPVAEQPPAPANVYPWPAR